ncbi:unnamed protein product [Ixodes hexagonus]
MELLVICIVIANIVTSQGNVRRTGGNAVKIIDQSLLIYDHSKCQYIGQKIKNGDVLKRGTRCQVKWTCLANQSELLVQG